MISKVVKNIFILFLLIALIGCTAETTNPEAGDEATKTETEGGDQGGELKVAFPSQPPTLDSHVTTSEPTSNIAHSIFETLVTLDTNYDIQPMLADSWEQSEDNKTITFHLRKGVLFHNGKEMVADDVVASLERWIKLSTLGQTFAGATVESKDDYMVVIHFPKPMSTALPTLAYFGANFSAIMPKEIIGNADDTGVKEYIGTGPFQFEEWKQDQYIRLTRFEDYQPRSEPADGPAGKREALLDEVTFVFSTDPLTQVAGLQTGEYDIVYRVPTDSVAQLESDPQIKTEVYPEGHLNLYFNKKEGLFADVTARQAITAALDNEAILKAAYSNEKFYAINHNMMADHKQWYSDIGQDLYNEHDLEKAKKLLKDAGYNGEEITLLSSTDFKDMYNAAVVIQEQLKQIGMNVKLEAYDWPTVAELREDKNGYDLLVQSQNTKPEPTSLFYLKKDYTGWTESPELDQLIDELRRAPSLDEATVVYEDLQQWFYDYMPIAKIGLSNIVIATRDTVKNHTYFYGPIYWNVTNNE